MSIETARALLEQALVELGPPPPPVPVTVVHAGDDLLAAVASAPVGTVLTLDPAFVFTGDLALTKSVTLVSAVAPVPAFPLPLARVDATLVGPTIRGSVTISGAAVSLIGLRIVGTVKEQDLVTTGPGTVIDRCVVLGSPQGQHRGVRAESVGARVLRSYIANIWSTDQDAQAVSGDSGTKDLLVDDCYLEASGENVLFGGSDNASADLNPQDIIVSNSTLSKQLAWLTRPAGQPAIIVKNLFELKNAQRVTLKNCVGTYSWPGGGQEGYAVVLTVRNQDGASPWATVTDVLIEDCTFSHLGGGVNVLGSDDRHPSGQMARVTIQRCSFHDIAPAVWGGSGRQIMIGNGPQQLAFDTVNFSGAGLNSCITFTNAVPANPAASKTLGGFSVSNVQAAEGDYGIQGDDAPGEGLPALQMYAPGFSWSAVTLTKNPGGLRSDGSPVDAIPYPPGTTVL